TASEQFSTRPRRGARRSTAGGTRGARTCAPRGSGARPGRPPRLAGAAVLLEAEEATALVDEEAGEPGEGGHVAEEEEGPAVAAGLALDDGEGAHALAGEREEDHEGEAGERGVDRAPVLAHLGADVLAQRGALLVH